MKQGLRRNGITAHRGDCEHFPENTLESVKAAVATGADWIEVDIQATRNGVLVLSHDESTGRTGNANMHIADVTLAELQTVHLGQGAKGPILIPALIEVLAFIRTQSQTLLSLQPKAGVVDQSVHLIRMLDAAHLVGFNDGDLAKMRRAKQLLPEAAILWDRHDYSPGIKGDAELMDDIRVAQTHGFEAIVLRKDTVTPDRIAMIRDSGIESGAWTVNDEAEMCAVFAAGVERIYTDFPTRGLRIKASQPARLGR